MKRFAILVTLIIMMLSLTGCVPKATEQECSDMCANLAILKAGADVKPLDKQIASIEESYAKRAVDENTRKDATLADLDKQMNDKLAAAQTDEEKKAITDEFTPLKETATQEAEAAVVGLQEKKAAEIQSVTERDATRKTDAEQLVTECKAQCQTLGTLQKVATCRIEAKDIDTYYNRCR